MTIDQATPTLRALVRDGAPVPPSQSDLGAVDGVDFAAWYHARRPSPTAASTADGAHTGRRPYAILGMIASIDGATTMDGLSGGLGNMTDRLILGAVRRAGRVVIVGSSTARDESYSAENFDGQRVGVVTGSGDLDYGSSLFTSGVGFVLTTVDTPVPDGVDVVRAGDDQVDMAIALHRIADVVGDVSTVVIEGGPTLNGAAVASGIIDEVCVTTSPKLVDGTSHRIAYGGDAVDEQFELAHLLFDSDSYLFARWVRSASAPA